jgi:hypothetical protein
MFESKASLGLKTERTRPYVSISIRGTTQLSDIRWGFEPLLSECGHKLGFGNHMAVYKRLAGCLHNFRPEL